MPFCIRTCLYGVSTLKPHQSNNLTYSLFALAGEDFASTPIVFEVSRSGDRTIEVPITPDDIYEPEQNFVIILELVNSSLSDRVEIGRRAAICRIADDDCKIYNQSNYCRP